MPENLTGYQNNKKLNPFFAKPWVDHQQPTVRFSAEPEVADGLQEKIV